MDIKKYFKGEKVNLVPFEEDHIMIVREWINNEDITSCMGRRFPVSKRDQIKWYDNISQDKTKKKLIIVDGKDREVGMVSIFNIDHKNQKTEIGVFINKEDQGNGYAKESLKMLVSFVFDELNMHKIYAHINSLNISSLQLFKKIGFILESRDIDSVYQNGEFVDILKYSIFNEGNENESGSNSST
jgi:RimJ/RimL family protein N-acetyltransferase